MIAMTQHGQALVATAAAARSIGVSARTLARWAREGSVHAALTTAGRQRRWDVADLRRQLDDRERQASTPPAPELKPPELEPPPEPVPLDAPQRKRPARRTPPGARVSPNTSWGRLLDPNDSIYGPPPD